MTGGTSFIGQTGVQQQAEYHTVTWDVGEMASGISFYRITTGDSTTTKRLVLME